MRRQPGALVALLTSLALVGCDFGGNDNNDNTPPATQPTPPAAQRGDLLQNPPTKLNSYTPADLLTALGGNDIGKTLVSLAVSPACSVDVYQLQYQTVGAKGESVTASGALMMPAGTAPSCSGPRPIVLYAHGTTASKTFNIANLAGANNAEGLAIAALFAGQGYIVVAPNYAGYDTSSLTYHPYLNADQQSKDMIDALTAARKALPVAATPSTTDGGKLFITGYSQGGYVAMATHRAMQAAGSTVTASAPMSGPYALSAFGDAIFEGQVSMSAIENLVLLIPSYQQAYGNIYSATTDVFEAKYATGIDTLLPNPTAAVSDLVSQGKLPANAVFNSTPPAPEFAPMTPATSPAEFAPLFAKAFGTDNLITNNYRLGYLRDAQTAPDGGFPTATDGLPPANPTHALRIALKTNDLRTWTPNVPVQLCGGGHDPTVFFFNTQLMQSYWTTHVPAGAVTVVDIDTAGDPYSDLRTSFQAAKDALRAAAVVGGAADGGDEAVQEAYHAGLVPPFCLSATKRFFDTR
jgi:pimeloyl-ACP methyl ester carboxylesterase